MTFGQGQGHESDHFAGEDYAEIVEEEGDYSNPARDYEIDRARVELHDIIGEGQFGDVHKGVYKEGGAAAGGVAIAVKTCKVDCDVATTEKFLEEACELNEVLKE